MIDIIMLNDTNETVCATTLVTSKEMFEWNTSHISSKLLLATASVLTCLTFCLFLESFKYMTSKVPFGARRGYLAWLIGIYPVFSATSLTGIYIPRASILANWCANIYLAVCIYAFLMLTVNYFGGVMVMVERLKDTKIRLNRPPLACCCLCLPNIILTEVHFHRIRIAVLQVCVIRPLVLFIAAVLWADGIYVQAQISKDSAFVYLNTVSLISTLIAVYSLSILHKASVEPLKGYLIKSKFISMKIVMLTTNIQNLVLAFLSRFGVIECSTHFSSEVRANILYNYLVVFETFFMLFIGRLILSQWKDIRCNPVDTLSMASSGLPPNIFDLDINDAARRNYISLLKSVSMMDETVVKTACENSRIVKTLETDV
ncbi:organic solute transporter subunit alpha-like [Antedon mediterranea]|uniref:organic solute transporter subunit alpha-like n=1 Tax=Antedon mediterranea TaxID=105859 RepID=UPI003AF9B731